MLRLYILCCLCIFINVFSLAQSKSIIQVSGDKHYFIDKAGKPFFWLGDTEWELFHQLSVPDAKALLLKRQKQGFTVIQVMVTGVFREWAMQKGNPIDTSNEAWIHGDPSRINEAYFKRVDSIVDYAATLDLVLVIGVYHSQDVDHERVTISNAKTWATWLAKRYSHSLNIVWSMYPHATSASLSILNEIIQGIHDGDGSRHLITVHPDPSPTSSSFFYPAQWLSFNTLQTWNTGFINYTMVLRDYRNIPQLPVVNGEARYEEEDGTTPEDTRRAGYFSMLAGGFYSYGHQDNWRSAATWRSWYASPGAKQMQVMKTIFEHITWWDLVPDSTILINHTEGNVTAISAKKKWIITYLSKPQTIHVSKKYNTLLKNSTIVWIDPVTGQTMPAIRENNGMAFTPPNWTDAVLLIKVSVH